MAGGVKALAAYLVLELALQAYDTFELYETLRDPDSTRTDMVLCASGYAVGMFAPGGGYGTGFKTARGVATKLTQKESDKFRAAARNVWESASGSRASLQGLDVHHRIPLEWAHLMPGDPNRIANLVGVDKITHKAINAAWEHFKRTLNGRDPTPAEVMAHARQLDELFANAMHFVK